MEEYTGCSRRKKLGKTGISNVLNVPYFTGLTHPTIKGFSLGQPALE